MQIRNIILAFALTLITVDARPTHYDQTTDGSGAPNDGLFNYNDPSQLPGQNPVEDCEKPSNDKPSIQPPIQPSIQPPIYNGGPDINGKVPGYKPRVPLPTDNGGHNNIDGNNKVPGDIPKSPPTTGGNDNHSYSLQPSIQPSIQPPIYNGGPDINGKVPGYKPRVPLPTDNGGHNNVDGNNKVPGDIPKPPPTTEDNDSDCDTTDTNPLDSDFTDPSSKNPTIPHGY